MFDTSVLVTAVIALILGMVLYFGVCVSKTNFWKNTKYDLYVHGAIFSACYVILPLAVLLTSFDFLNVNLTCSLGCPAFCIVVQGFLILVQLALVLRLSQWFKNETEKFSKEGPDYNPPAIGFQFLLSIISGQNSSHEVGTSINKLSKFLSFFVPSILAIFISLTIFFVNIQNIGSGFRLIFGLITISSTLTFISLTYIALIKGFYEIEFNKKYKIYYKGYSKDGKEKEKEETGMIRGFDDNFFVIQCGVDKTVNGDQLIQSVIRKDRIIKIDEILKKRK